MKRIIFILVISLSLLSCDSDFKEESLLTKEQLETFIKNKNPNYVFHKNLAKSNTKLVEPIHFNNLLELDNFINEIEESKSNAEEGKHLLTYDNDNELFNGGSGANIPGLFRIQRWRGFYYHNTTFFVDESCNGTQLKSFLSGFTLGVSYSENSSKLTKNYPHISYTVSGVIDYSIVVQGIGTYYSEYVNYSGTHDCPGI
ncbi:hypothetical protein [Polaribacter sp. SA4-12]|uniref:hypothetical protein n=1 Tax=Polaribacter sp. SA4-12 TaxID=1312072 RepID=UPI000B3C8C33|nr:hypothetical protein [Polaribacter sp. SA4-12]ARV15732.1 hypothetical protein BTO07_11555 [Polaribacter sp. SA4-12]